MPRLHAILFLLVVLFGTGRALAQGDPSGIDFVTIGDPGNPAWPGNGTPNDHVVGRGSVDYAYRIGRYEVTTSQFVDFFNAAFDRPQSDWLPNLIPPTHWGAVSTTPHTPGGLRWTVPAGNEMLPVGNIDWRMAAMYCNWLCNDKSTARSAFMNGAYDATTFGTSPTGFTDQITHNPGARYYIPTWDEWLKAAHWSPTNPNHDGWYLYPNAGDNPLVYGPPGVLVNGLPTQANGAWESIEFPGHDPFSIPLGAYPTVQSPWGLFDCAGATAEWTEEVVYVNGLFPAYRVSEGSPWASPGATGLADLVNDFGDDFPNASTADLGFRIAASIPSPSACAVGALVLSRLLCRARRGSRRSRFF
jgi:formylglycine-generating enzyme required for sulfatase activity